MSECIPSLVAKSTVGLVASVNQFSRQIGSGTLLAIAEHRFVLTAAHVIRQASESGATLGISGTIDGLFITAKGTWALSEAAKTDGDENDIAIYELTKDECRRFADDVFVRIGDVAFPSNVTHSYFVVSGFPSMWSTSIGPSEPTVHAKMLQYGTIAFQGNAVALPGFNPNYHFLLEASPDLMIDHQGNETYFRTRTGHSASMPRDLGGISGCSVWVLGDLRKPLEKWMRDDARLVGVETSVYVQSKAIKVTRWNAVTSLLYAAFPQVRPVLEMYARQHESGST